MAVASLSLRNLARHYGKVRAARRSRPRGPRGRLRHAARPVGLRQEHDAQHHRRASTAGRRHDHARRPRHHAGAAERAADGDGVPELRALPEHDRVRQHRVLAQAARRPADEITERASTAVGEMLDIGAPAGTQAGPAVGRPAAARRARPGARQAAARLPARRAVQQPRRVAARPHAHGGQAPPPRASAPRSCSSPTTRKRR